MWQVLGIEATDDPSAIRRAYAARLKAINPDREPEAFRALRQAYESALARSEHAARRRFGPPPKLDPEEEEAETDPTIDDEAGEDDASDKRDGARIEKVPDETEALLASAARESTQVRQKFRNLLACEDWLGAATELVSASARGLLPLMEEERLAAEVVTGALRDRETTPVDLRVIARCLHWDEPLPWNRGEQDALRQRLRARLDAETWHEGVVKQAGYRPSRGLNLQARLWGDPKQVERVAAAMVLGQVPLRDARFFKKWLDPLVDQADRHQASLPEGRLHPDLIASLRSELAAVAPKPARKVRPWIWILVLIGIAHLVGLILNSN